MVEYILEDSQVENLIKKIKFRFYLGITTFLFCFVFGFLFFFIIMGIFYETDISVINIIILTLIFFVIVITGICILYLVGLCARKSLLYYKLIKPLQLDYISVNYKSIISKKNQIYIIYSAFANGVYFIQINNDADPSPSSKKPKKLPQSIIGLNKKVFGDLSIKFGEFEGLFKIPLNKGEDIVGNARVFFMPMVTFSKTQNTTDYIIRMLDIVQEKPF